MASCFFVGYAENDGADVYVQRFFDDLQRAVRTLVGPHRRYSGELSEPSHPFSPFSTNLRPPMGILSCRVYVALYSEAYFASARCMREWSLFHERMRWYQQRSGRSAPCLVGVPWSMDVASMPDVVLAASILPNTAMEAARAGGMVELIRDVRRTKLYRTLVGQIAALVSAGADIGLPAMTETDAPFVQPHPAFGPGIRSASAEHVPEQSPAPAGGPGDRPSVRSRVEASMGRVGVIIGAAPVDGQPEERTRREFYGTASEDWQPFRPASDQPAYTIARRTLVAMAIHDTVCYPPTSRLPEDLACARDEQRVVVIILDPWLVRSKDYRAVVLELAHRILDDRPVAGTLVVFNPSDEETESHAEELRAELQYQLVDDKGTATRLSEVRTREQLVESMVPIVIRAQHALMRASPRPPEGSGDAPGSTTDRPSQRVGELDRNDRTKPVLRRHRRNGTEQQT